MAKVTISELLERIESMQLEIDALKEQLSSSTQIQYVSEVRPPGKISTPINFMRMVSDMAHTHAFYVEEEDSWGQNKYL